MNKEEQIFTSAKLLRKKAEELLAQKQKLMDDTLKEYDEKKLLHELQVHQIELEMQNEELLMEIEIAEKALKKNAILFDLAPMGYITLDASGNIYEINQSGARMLGENKSALINKNFNKYVAENTKAVFANFILKVFESYQKVSCQITLEKDKKPLGYVYMEGILISEEDRCLLSVVDISGSPASHQYQIPVF